MSDQLSTGAPPVRSRTLGPGHLVAVLSPQTVRPPTADRQGRPRDAPARSGCHGEHHGLHRGWRAIPSPCVMGLKLLAQRVGMTVLPQMMRVARAVPAVPATRDVPVRREQKGRLTAPIGRCGHTPPWPWAHPAGHGGEPCRPPQVPPTQSVAAGHSHELVRWPALPTHDDDGAQTPSTWMHRTAGHVPASPGPTDHPPPEGGLLRALVGHSLVRPLCRCPVHQLCGQFLVTGLQ